MKKGDCFAIEHGKFIGKFIVFIEEYKSFYRFLMLPGTFKILDITKNDFNNLKKVNELGASIVFVENLPDNVYEQLKLQYFDTKKDKNNIVRYN